MIFYDPEDKSKVRFKQILPLRNHIVNITKIYYTAGKRISPDEIMTKFTGYCPDK